MNQNLKEYKIIANLCIEIDPLEIDNFIDHLTDEAIDLAEAYKGYLGGGFKYDEVKEDAQ